MARDGARPPLPRLLRRGAVPAQDDLALVHGWLRRCVPAEQVEELSVEVLARAAGPGPGCLAAADRTTRLQHLAVQAVLRSRGVL